MYKKFIYIIILLVVLSFKGIAEDTETIKIDEITDTFIINFLEDIDYDTEIINYLLEEDTAINLFLEGEKNEADNKK